MARPARRATTLQAPVDRIWRIVSDPHHLPRWWPRTERVENVRTVGSGRRSQWTKVLRTDSGRGVRADFRCVSAAEGKHYVWEQEIAGTPFEKHLAESTVEIRLEPADGGTRVAISSRQRLRGISRFGAPLMRRATARILDDALAGLAHALGERE